jgi:hypothetical protein
MIRQVALKAIRSLFAKDRIGDDEQILQEGGEFVFLQDFSPQKPLPELFVP